MDTRTREKYRAQVRIMTHALEGHYSRLPAGSSITSVMAQGLAAAQALGFDLMAGEARALAGRTVAVGRGVDALFCPPVPACGIERSLPNGDA